MYLCYIGAENFELIVKQLDEVRGKFVMPTQDHLNKIFECCNNACKGEGSPVEGWGCNSVGDRDYLTDHQGGRTFERKCPDGQWEEIPRIGDGRSAQPSKY